MQERVAWGWSGPRLSPSRVPKAQPRSRLGPGPAPDLPTGEPKPGVEKPTRRTITAQISNPRRGRGNGRLPGQSENNPKSNSPRMHRVGDGICTVPKAQNQNIAVSATLQIAKPSLGEGLRSGQFHRTGWVGSEGRRGESGFYCSAGAIPRADRTKVPIKRLVNTERMIGPCQSKCTFRSIIGSTPSIRAISKSRST